MASTTGPGLARRRVPWSSTTYPETVIAEALGATFFSLDEKNWPNFATIVTTDEHDRGRHRTWRVRASFA